MPFRAIVVLAVLVAAVAACSPARADPTPITVKIHNNLPRPVLLLHCKDTTCQDFPERITLAAKATTSVNSMTDTTDVYLVMRLNFHRLGCLIFAYKKQPTAVRRVSPTARCPH